MKATFLAALLSAVAPPLYADAQSAGGATAARAPADTLRREVGLREIGFESGLEFERLSGTATAFFPVGAREAIRGMTLTLELLHGQTMPVERHLKLRVNDRLVHVEPLGPDDARRSLTIDLPPEAAQNGFVKLGLSYSGASSENICVDERASGDFLRVLPDSALTIALDHGALDTVARVAQVMPPKKVLEADIDAALGRALPFALRAAALYDGEAGLVTAGRAGRTEGDLWSATRLRLDAPDPGTAEGASVRVIDAGGPALAFGGPDPDLGLALADSRWRAVGGGTATATELAAGRAAQGTVSFAQLGAPDLTQFVTGSSTFEFGFASDAFAPGRLPGAIELLVAAAASPTGRGVTVSTYLNGTLLGSRPLDSASPVWMDFDIPDGLVSRDNQVQVLVQRQTEGGNCMVAPQGYPAQILPQSRFTLTDAPAARQDFFLMRQAFGAGVDVIAADASAADLPWLLPVAGALLPDTVEIALADTITAPVDGAAPKPFLYVGRTAPEGSEPAVRFDRGRVEIRDAAEDVLYSGRAIDEVGIVQIVEASGRPGIWVRPGTGAAPAPTPETPLSLDRGDLAFLDGDGVAVVTSTRQAGLVAVAYPDRIDALQILAKYRPWIIGAAWLALTLVVIRFLQGVYRKSRRGAEG